MKFILSTKPLKDALSLGVIKSNVSKFYQKSCLAQVTATKTTLKINLEALSIKSEIILKGSGDEDGTKSIFVDCLTFKDLVSTFDTNTIELEYTDGGLLLHSGKSKFTLSQMVEESDLELSKPSLIPSDCAMFDLCKENWKFVDNHQMFAIAMSFIHPVYTNVWVGDKGQVIVGDFDNSIFTLSNKSTFHDTCLLPDTIINLFTSLPEGSQIAKLENSYVVQVKSDSFEYFAEFTPKREDDEGVGSYNSEIILSMLVPNLENSIGTGNTDLSDCYELSRFCNKLNTSVVGGASKLFKYFLREYSPKKVRSFSDRAHTKGNLYSILGFHEVNRSEVGYMWVNLKTNIAYSRLNAQKQNVKRFLHDDTIDLSKTENQIMVEHGFVQVYDSGTITWEYTNKGDGK